MTAKTFLMDGSQAIRLDTVASVTTDELGFTVLVSETGERFNLGRAVAAKDALAAAQYFSDSGLGNVELSAFLTRTTPFPMDLAYWLSLDSAGAREAGRRILSSLNAQNISVALKAMETGIAAGRADELSPALKSLLTQTQTLASSPAARALAVQLATQLLKNASTKR